MRTPQYSMRTPLAPIMRLYQLIVHDVEVFDDSFMICMKSDNFDPIMVCIAFNEQSISIKRLVVIKRIFNQYRIYTCLKF